MNIFNNRDISFCIFDSFINHYDNLSVLRLVSTTFKNNLIKKYDFLLKSTCIKNFFFNYNTFIILRNIKNKLYLANEISDEFYNEINPTNLYTFNKSISWGICTYANETWLDLFSYNTIVWTNDEIEFLKLNYNINHLIM